VRRAGDVERRVKVDPVPADALRMTHQTGVPAGWYPDPAAAGSTRWWDGQAWTQHVALAPPTAMPAQPVYAAQPAYAAQPTVAPQPAYAAQPGYGSPTTYAGHPGHAAPPAAGVGAHPNDPVHWLVPTGRSGLAITAGYLGIAALFCFIAAPFALGVGILALRRLSSQDEKHGKGRAIFAIVAGVFGLIVALLVLVTSRS
jgi:hypothetical protein